MLRKQRSIIAIFIAVILASCLSWTTHAATNTFSVSPMYQMVALEPGETYVGNFKVTNPDTSDNSR